jgi:hypothetical protein
MTAEIKPRAVLEQAIEALIAVLDTIEPDPDLEEPGDLEDGEDPDMEPSLGGAGYWTDAGLQHDLEQDKSDDEPSLGRLETFDQGGASYVTGWVTDGEQDVLDEPHDDNELEADPAERDRPGRIDGGQGA